MQRRFSKCVLIIRKFDSNDLRVTVVYTVTKHTSWAHPWIGIETSMVCMYYGHRKAFGAPMKLHIQKNDGSLTGKTREKSVPIHLIRIDPYR